MVTQAAPSALGGTCCSSSQFQMARLGQREFRQLIHSPPLTPTAVVVVLPPAAQVPSLMWTLLLVGKGQLQSAAGQRKSETVRAAARQHSLEHCREPPGLLAAQAETPCTAASKGSCPGKAGCLQRHCSSLLSALSHLGTAWLSGDTTTQAPLLPFCR